MMDDSSSYQAALSAARDSYSQLLAFLIPRAGGDIASAEDALGDAFLAALSQWPDSGVPDKPDAWLLTTAKRRLMDSQRRGATRLRQEDALIRAITTAQAVMETTHDFPDERLKLLFVCAHPAIDPAARAPLCLQMVMGLDASRIASAFLVSPSAMSQRLVRAKTKIREAGIPFHIPAENEWPERLDAIMDAIYVAFGAGWESSFLDGIAGSDLEDEAIWLARLLTRLVPNEPEVMGLLALMLHCHSRRAARRSVNGEFVPLTKQDTQLWSGPLIREADDWLRKAARCQTPGRFQLEAAIQSVHAERRGGGCVNWAAIEGFYQLLKQHTTSVGASIGHAIACSEIHGPKKGLQLLEALDHTLLETHQPYWAARAHLLRNAGQPEEAFLAYQQAVGLSTDDAVRKFLIHEMEKMRGFQSESPEPFTGPRQVSTGGDIRPE